MRQNHLGNSGTYFWFGVVEDRNDPLKVGRLRVRIFGDHPANKASVPTDHLPWSQCMMPANENEGGVPDIKEGSSVFGIYLDGEEKQSPFILGVVPGIVSVSGSHQQGFNDPREVVDSSYPGLPEVAGNGIQEPSVRSKPSQGSPTTSGYSRGAGGFANTAKDALKKTGIVAADNGGSLDEPDTPYAAKYPYNHTKESESGHVIELDDTPGAERVHIFHRTGTYIEVHPDGKIVKKCTNSSFDIVATDSIVVVGGNETSVVEGKGSKRIQDGYTIEVTSGDHKVDVLAGNCNVFVNGNMTVDVKGVYTLNANSINMNGMEYTKWNSTGDISLSGKTISLN